MSNDVIDLVGGSSPPSQLKAPMSPLLIGWRRRRPKGDRGGNSNYKNNIAPEVIDLEADDDAPPPPVSTSMNGSGMMVGRGRRRILRSWIEMGHDDDDDDDDIVEIIVPARTAAPSSSSPFPSAAKRRAPSSSTLDGKKNWVGRIRDVFPLVSRSKVESLLAKAASYYSTTDDPDDEEGAFHAVMTVLAECDPTGASIPEASLVAVVVGGRPCGDGRGSSKSGCRKVAKLECQCCFAEHNFEDMVSCRLGGHLFCVTCLQRHTEQRVFGVGNFGVRPDAVANAIVGANGARRGRPTSKALEILCMASDCTSGFREEQLRRALSEKLLKKYNELQYVAVIESANMTDVSKCKKCQFMAVRDDALPPLLFHCPQCSFKSCTECGEEYHPNMRCDQVESKNETDGRTKVEEAMTSALIRTCPRPFCRKKFLKTDGCNKMTCSCGCLVCYVCGVEIPAIVGYKHFCQTSVASPPLFHSAYMHLYDRKKKHSPLAPFAVYRRQASLSTSVLQKMPFVGRYIRGRQS
jgi:hypothetical protein